MNILGHRIRTRPASESQTGRVFADLSIDGESLLENLSTAHWRSRPRAVDLQLPQGAPDLMSCFVRGYELNSAHSLSQLTLQVPAGAEDGRIPLYICPECGSIDCGAYAVRVERQPDRYLWTEFAYQSATDDRIVQVGAPYGFASDQYESALLAASRI